MEAKPAGLRVMVLAHSPEKVGERGGTQHRVGLEGEGPETGPRSQAGGAGGGLEGMA